MTNRNLDHIDRLIIAQLAKDGRTTARDMAKLLPVDEGATRNRMQRLLASTVRVRALFDPGKVGFPIQAYLGIKVRPANTKPAVQRLAGHECARYISCFVGLDDVGAFVVAQSIRDLQQFLRRNVRIIEGVESAEANIFFETETGFFVTMSPHLLRTVSAPVAGLDASDFQIMACLAQDGRKTVRDIALELGMKEMTTLRRLNKLIDNKVMTIRGMVEAESLGFPVSVMIGLKVSPNRIDAVAKALGKHKQMNMVTTCTGRFDLIVHAIFRGSADLDKVLNEFIRPMDGVKEATVGVVLGETRAKEAWIVPRFVPSDSEDDSSVKPVRGEAIV